LHIRGASGSPVPPQLDEVDEARRVVDRVATWLGCPKFHDNISTNQSSNLNAIVNWHNNQTRDLDVSVHFNAYDGNAHGTEVLYVSSAGLEIATPCCNAICAAGDFTNRGAKKRTDLAFLNGTNEPAILIETCFCDNTADSNKYNVQFEAICRAIAEEISGQEFSEQPPEQPPEGPEVPPEALLYVSGKCSWFGGPEDTGVSPSEGLAFIYSVGDAPHLFLPYQPEGTSGLARRLNPYVHFVACRWDYDVTPKPTLLDHMALVRNPKTGFSLVAFPADWGPNETTGRVADLSKSLLDDLDLTTDDVVEVTYPYDD
jgi:N-acetylmuramoyl-L-alanine amidase